MPGFLHRADLDKKEEEIKKLKDMHPAINKGKGLMKVQNRQRRKMAALKENTKEALAFTESYEVNLKSISFETRHFKLHTSTNQFRFRIQFHL